MQKRTASKRLEAARMGKKMSLDRAWSRVDHALGPLAVSSQQIRNYELGKVPEEEWNPLVIKVLAETYEKKVEEISEVAARETERVLVLLRGDGEDPRVPGGDETGADGSIDLRGHESRCIAEIADQQADSEKAA